MWFGEKMEATPRHGISPLPIAHGLVADSHSICKFHLGHILFFAQLRHAPPDHNSIKHFFHLSLLLLHSLFSQKKGLSAMPADAS